jgi:uncharacterized Zn finger protein
MEPFAVDGLSRKGPVARSFWGAAWCERMERCGDYQDRLAPGRALLRAGAVHDLAITAREVFAYVAGEDWHEVLLKIDGLGEERTAALRASCAGAIGGVLELLEGKLGPETLARLTDPDTGLVPGPGEIRFLCDCADHAGLCAHGAAVLYAVGAWLDREPEALLRLRDVAWRELVDGVVAEMENSGSGAPGGELADADLGGLFGIDLIEGGR